MKSFKERSKQINKENILKDGFSPKKINEISNFDVIIIGSGIGGLTTAALLSRIGKKVLILEQHDIIGGCTHTFTEKGFEFDTGVHYLGQQVTNSHSIVGYIFHLLGLGNIKWSKMDKIYDRAAISPILSEQTTLTEKKKTNVKNVDFTDNLEETKNNIKKLFPGEENAIDSYFHLVKWTSFAFPLYIFFQFLPNWLGKFAEKIFSPFLSVYFEKTTRQVLSKITKNEDLLGVLTYLWGDYGLPPDRSAFVMTGLLIDHFSNGAYYPTGGSSVFAESFLPTILANGGRAFVRAPVSRIILSSTGDKVLGVTVKDIDIFAPIVISACGVLRTFTELIPSTQICSHADEVRKHFFLCKPDKSIKREDLDINELSKSTQIPPPDLVAPSLSMFSLYIGINASPKELKIPSRNLWLFADWNHDNMTKENLSSSKEVTLSICKGETNNLVPFLPMAFIGSASAKDDSWNERYPDKCVLEVLTAADFSSYWEATRLEKNSKPKHRGEIYNKMKKQTEDKLLEIVYEQYPQIKGKVSFIDSGTPLTNNFYIGALNGEVYGLEHSVTRFTKCKWFLKSKTPISGLYLSGQDILVDGIVGALMGGVLCAITINPFKVLYDLIATYIIEEL